MLELECLPKILQEERSDLKRGHNGDVEGLLQEYGLCGLLNAFGELHLDERQQAGGISEVHALIAGRHGRRARVAAARAEAQGFDHVGKHEK